MNEEHVEEILKIYEHVYEGRAIYFYAVPRIIGIYCDYSHTYIEKCINHLASHGRLLKYRNEKGTLWIRQNPAYVVI